jgi:uncharacterized membrane protein
MLNGGLVSAVATTGAVVAGVALFEAALVPAVVIGAAAILVPKVLPRNFQPFGRRRSKRAARGAAAGDTASGFRRILPDSLSDLTHVKMSRTLVKTITFRVIVTSLDFTANYLILQQASTAAGLSAISIVGGPLFYFLHESAWNYLVGKGHIKVKPESRFMNQPIVKTVTYRTFATIIEFTTNYVVVGDLATAALLSSFGFFLGPFVYYGHELAWEHFGEKNNRDGTARWSRPAPVVIDVEPVPSAV